MLGIQDQLPKRSELVPLEVAHLLELCLTSPDLEEKELLGTGGRGQLVLDKSKSTCETLVGFLKCHIGMHNLQATHLSAKCFIASTEDMQRAPQGFIHQVQSGQHMWH